MNARRGGTGRPPAADPRGGPRLAQRTPWPTPIRAVLAVAVVVALVAANVRLLTGAGYLALAYGPLRPGTSALPGTPAWTAAAAETTADYVAGRQPRPAVAQLASESGPAVPVAAGREDGASASRPPARAATAPTDAAPSGSPGPALYGAAELDHLADVRRVIRALFALGLASAALVAAAWAADMPAGGRRAAAAIAAGGRLGIAVVAATGGLIALAWDRLFTAFHAALFPPGSWRFPSDSGLIRLFPDWFWQRSAIVLAALLLVECLVLAAAAGRRGRRG